MAGKAGRNESRKLFAGLLNNIATASMLAAWLQPAIGLLRQHQLLRQGDAVASLLLMVIGTILALVAQLIVRRLED